MFTKIFSKLQTTWLRRLIEMINAFYHLFYKLFYFWMWMKVKWLSLFMVRLVDLISHSKLNSSKNLYKKKRKSHQMRISNIRLWPFQWTVRIYSMCVKLTRNRRRRLHEMLSLQNNRKSNHNRIGKYLFWFFILNSAFWNASRWFPIIIIFRERELNYYYIICWIRTKLDYISKWNQLKF